VAAEFDNPTMLYSVGKDSAVTSGLSYEQSLAAFNAEVAGLVRKYFSES
jgi:3'-phosphoadenosine 5'-phosphosulfate sulfotransferase (PAPS reductase)/FAD synthetase